ncbi:MAG: DUF427 domain-containing protein [Arenicellales bacterium]
MSRDYRSSIRTAAGVAESEPGEKPEHRVVIEDSPKRVRVFFGSRAIADTCRVKLMHETGHLPIYYFPRQDVEEDCLVASGHTSFCPVKGDARYWSVRAGGRTAQNAAWNYPRPVAGCPDISGLVAFYWNSMDAWYEEEEQVFVHARDPYKRIDVLDSARHVEVVVDGAKIADSHRPYILFETGLPPRFYLPKLDVRMDLLEPTATRTACPYKGETAQYWTATANGQRHTDLAWCYEYTTPEASRIAGRVCFYDERVDLYLDGELQERPVTQWS